MRILAVLAGLFALCLAQPVAAQDRMWLQIEAQPDLALAMDRARAYAAMFGDVEGYKLGNGWYGIALGPQPRGEAEARLLELRRQNLIPPDSFLADASSYGQRFWPAGAEATDEAAVTPQTTPEAETAETLAGSKAAEAALSDAERMTLQEALGWYGFYEGGVDGHFGRGTRAAMAAWQEANGFEATGVLSTAQRGLLTDTYATDQAEFGFETVSEPEAGIEITLPMALIRFDRYEPPFVHYAPKAGSGLKVLLISEPGGASGLAGLYDVLQTLELVPPNGERALGEGSFTITGSNDKIETRAYAAAENGNIKGYLISWNRADGERMARVLPAVQASFRAVGDQVLDPGLVPLSEAAKRGLLTGLEVRHPKRSRSGIFIDTNGTVVTTFEAVAGCGKVVLEREIPAKVTYSDPASGIAILSPDTPLAPQHVAAFVSAPPRLGAAVSLSGYSYEDKLPAPVLTLGVVEEAKGLNGETGLTRLSLDALPGDTGGPVLDQSGAVLGMLLPPDPKAAKRLPEGVAFAASAQALTATLTAQGLIPTSAVTGDKPAPDALSAIARGMTVLVSCWE